MKETLKLSYTKQVLIEVLNAATHGIGALLSIIATVALILKGVQHGSHLEIVSYAIYGASLFLLFLNSTLYHSFSLTRYKDVFQKIDHSSIYLLIAGTYTPYLMVSIGGLAGYGFLALVWALAIGGIIFEVSAIGRWPKLSTFLYLGLGWLSVFIIYPLAQSIDRDSALSFGRCHLLTRNDFLSYERQQMDAYHLAPFRIRRRRLHVL